MTQPALAARHSIIFHPYLARPQVRLSASIQDQLRLVMQKSLADSTLSTYASGLRSFLRFCAEEGLRLIDCLPASEHLLCAFAASEAGRYQHQTVRNHINGIRAWHIIQGVPWNGGNRLQYALHGVQALAPPAKPPRPPVTLAMLEVLHLSLDVSQPLYACSLALASVAFWSPSRLGEFCTTSSLSYDPRHTPARQNLGPMSSMTGSCKIHLPYTKTKRFAGDDVLVMRHDGPSDPMAALRQHLLVNKMPAHIPLFSYWHEGRWRCLTKRTFMEVCNSVWTARGYSRLTGHSFRIGGTTELLRRGVDPSVVQVIGRWSSNAFLRYWRRLDEILPQHVRTDTSSRRRRSVHFAEAAT